MFAGILTFNGDQDFRLDWAPTTIDGILLGLVGLVVYLVVSYALKRKFGWYAICPWTVVFILLLFYFL